MIIGGHSYSQITKKLKSQRAKNWNWKNLKHLNKLTKTKLVFFAYPYGGKSSYTNTINILRQNKVKYIFDTGDKVITKKTNFNSIPRINCNKFSYGKIYKYNND